jgi:hypothetical protein
MRSVKDAAKDYAESAFVAVGAAVWARLEPPRPWPVVESMAPGDNLQRAMNLVMPLHPRALMRRGRLAADLVAATEMIVVGLNNVGTVHFARFTLVGRNLCMVSIYDGDVTGYLRDFITVIGQAFDAILGYVKDPPPTPVGRHPDEFIAWIAAHDSFQMPEVPTDLHPDLRGVERHSLLVLRRERNVQLGIYRGYPGYSAAQIRDHLGIGW